MDILDEKFAIIAFIAGLEVQSKDLMFSISKNPQASMTEVLPKQRSISTMKKPSRPSKEALLLKRKRARTTKKKKKTKPQETGTQGQIPKEEQRKQRAVPDKTTERQGSQGTISA